MELALNDIQLPIKAGVDAPAQARCLHCGDPVVLRHRRRSSRPGDETYFWRHADHAGTACPARFFAARIKTAIKHQ